MKPVLLCRHRARLAVLVEEEDFLSHAVAYAEGLQRRELVRRVEAEATLLLTGTQFSIDTTEVRGFDDGVGFTLCAELMAWLHADPEWILLRVASVEEPGKNRWLLTVQIMPSEAASSGGAGSLQKGLDAVAELLKLMENEVGQAGGAIDQGVLQGTIGELCLATLALEIVSVRPSTYSVATDVPTLQDDVERAREDAARRTAELRAIDKERERAALRGSTQRWHFTKGAVDWLDAAASKEASQHADADGGGGDGDGGGGGGGGGASTSRYSPTTAQAELASQMGRADDALRAAAELKSQRAQIASELRAANAVVAVIEELHARSEWADVCVPHRPELTVDMAWNLPLVDPAKAAVAARRAWEAAAAAAAAAVAARAAGRGGDSFSRKQDGASRRQARSGVGGSGHGGNAFSFGGGGGGQHRAGNIAAKPFEDERSAAERGLTQVCYYCAQLSPPVRGAHTFITCSKRKRAGVSEYRESALAELLTTLREELVAARTEIDALGRV